MKNKDFQAKLTGDKQLLQKQQRVLVAFFITLVLGLGMSTGFAQVGWYSNGASVTSTYDLSITNIPYHNVVGGNILDDPGSFYKRSDGTWVESNESGSYYFKEAYRTNKSIHLIPADDRNVNIVLDFARSRVVVNGHDLYQITKESIYVDRIKVHDTSESGEDEVYLGFSKRGHCEMSSYDADNNTRGQLKTITRPQIMNEDSSVSIWNPNLTRSIIEKETDYYNNQAYSYPYSHLCLNEDDGRTGQWDTSDDALGEFKLSDYGLGTHTVKTYGDGGEYEITFTIKINKNTYISKKTTYHFIKSIGCFFCRS